MSTFNILRFAGIQTKEDSEDQNRGTMRTAESIVISPNGAVCGLPVFKTAWDMHSVSSLMANAIPDASAAHAHFVGLADAYGNKVLMVWDKQASVCRGLFFYAIGSRAPDFEGAVNISALNQTAWRNKTPGLQWYASVVGGRMILGNGIDPNVVIESGVLSILGPDSPPTDASNPSRYRIPPCTSFIQDSSGAIYAAGNAAAPMRIFVSESPNQAHPVITGLKTPDRSFTDLYPAIGATRITALSPSAQGVIAHCGSAGAYLLGSLGRDGGAVSQVKLDNSSGAINPACVSSWSNSLSYLASDYEIYASKPVRAGVSAVGIPRDTQIETQACSGVWNAGIDKASALAFIVDDTVNARLWVWAKHKMGDVMAFYCLDRKSGQITGPGFYPDLVAVAAYPRSETANQSSGTGGPFLMLGISRQGALICCDLGSMGEPYNISLRSSAMDTAYKAKTSATVEPGFSSIGVLESAGVVSFLYMQDSAGRIWQRQPWGEWSAYNDTPPSGVKWFNNAYLGVMEIRNETFGQPAANKDMINMRVFTEINPYAYFGIFTSCEGRRAGKWRGTPFPGTEIISRLFVSGRSIDFRVLFVGFYDRPMIIRGISFDYLASTL
jgi:hypothetical protein